MTRIDRARAKAKELWPFRGRRGRPQLPHELGGTALIRPLRSLTAWPAVLAAALTVLTALGAAPASAATLPAVTGATLPAVTGVTWHPLSLIDGWQSDQATWDSGNPAWAVKGGMVYLSGSLHHPSGGITDTPVTVLPVAARPAHKLFLSVYTIGGTTGYLDISPNGDVWAYSTPSSNVQDYASLAGVSFPAAATARHALSLLDGWRSGRPAFGTGNPAYSLAGGIVHLSGSLVQPGGSGSDKFAVLPPAARPARVLYVDVFTYADIVGIVVIFPDGEMTAYDGQATALTSLDGITFPAASVTAHPLGLLNGWQSSQSAWQSGDPAYTIAGGVVHLSGSAHQAAGNNDVLAVLPPAARPRHKLWIMTYTNGGAPGVVAITPAGLVKAWGNTPGAAQAYTSLAAISYPLGS